MIVSANKIFLSLSGDDKKQPSFVEKTGLAQRVEHILLCTYALNSGVFNIGGNKVRLVAAIHFNRNKLYVRHVLSHAEYDKGKWKE